MDGKSRRLARARVLAAMESGPDGAAPLAGGAENEPARTSTAERLLDTAAKLFWTKGYASTTTREIAELLGVRKASLYHHISGKEDLLFQISVNSLEHITREVTVAVEACDDPVERVRTLIGAHVASMIEDQDKHSVMLTELRALSPGRRAQIVAMRDEYERVVFGVLERACAAGALRGDVPVKYLALSLLNLLNWSIFWFQPDGGLSRGQLAEYLATLYLSGACKAAEGGHLETEPPARSRRIHR
jgi:AcrR family transcriptional regulator